ncbi:MAG: ATP-binding cassette domain-containing protein, partial [Armatimonadetes bacterium]|nr:ATP-binding cassette domain-containing protein [Armatimonadota bacterium]
MSAEAVLHLRQVTKRFGGLTAVDSLDFAVAPGQVKALIGPNGAGKTTVFNLVTGVYPVDGGEIRIAGQVTSGLPSHRVAALGVARTFQHVELFGNMSVLENVMVGAHTRSNSGMLSAALRLRGMRAQERQLMDRAISCLHLVGLGEVPPETESLSLAFGQQRLLEMARALAAEPALLLLDEPAAGLSTAETA